MLNWSKKHACLCVRLPTPSACGGQRWRTNVMDDFLIGGAAACVRALSKSHLRVFTSRCQLLGLHNSCFSWAFITLGRKPSALLFLSCQVPLCCPLCSPHTLSTLVFSSFPFITDTAVISPSSFSFTLFFFLFYAMTHSQLFSNHQVSLSLCLSSLVEW